MDTPLISRAWIESNEAILNSLPFPIYCTAFDSGYFIYASPAFKRLLGCNDVDLVADNVRGESFYADGFKRHSWWRELRAADGNTCVFLANLQRPFSPGDTDTLFALDVAQLIAHGEEEIALGMLVDVTEREHAWRLDRNRLNIYRQILNLPWIAIGLHEVNADGCVQWMNDTECRLLSVHKEWLKAAPQIAELSEFDRLAKACRVQRKLRGTQELTRREHRTFVTPEKTPKPIPVNIEDFGVIDPRGSDNKYAELFTVVRDERVPSELKHILLHFGVENPLLEDIDIRTFIKVQHRYAHEFVEDKSIFNSTAKRQPHELVFVYGNKSFLAELKMLSEHGQTDVLIDDEGDFLGQTDSELFGEYALSFYRSDDLVLRRNDADERIEKHPSINMGDEPIDVQVLKAPVYRPADPEIPIGVQGFYWAAGGEDQRNKLKELYAPWEILNEAPVAVFRKNLDHQFTFANDKFLEELQSAGAKALQIRDIIGKRYGNLLDEKWAKIYEEDDSRVVNEDLNPYEREGRIGNKNVWIVKKPIKRLKQKENGSAGEAESVGIQGVFWKLNGNEGSPIHKLVWVDWHHQVVHIVGEVPCAFSGGAEWHLFDALSWNLGEVVPYECIAEFIPGCRPESFEGVDKKRDAAIHKMHNLMVTLKGKLNRANSLLKDRFEFKVEEGVGYQMSFFG